MVRNNYTKVEEALKEGMQQMEIERLHQEVAKKEGATIDERQKQLQQRVLAIKVALKWALKQDKGIYQKIGIDQKRVLELLQKSTFVEEELALLNELLTKLEYCKRESEKSRGITSDEELVNAERKKQITKRFNVNSRWLPLK